MPQIRNRDKIREFIQEYADNQEDISLDRTIAAIAYCMDCQRDRDYCVDCQGGNLYVSPDPPEPDLKCNACGWTGKQSEVHFGHDDTYCPSCLMEGEMSGKDSG